MPVRSISSSRTRASCIVGGPEVAVDAWQRIWDVNVMAHVHAAHAVLPSMLARGRGYLLNTCSAAGLLTQIGSAPYAVTKHAAVAFSEWLSITYGDRGIRVSALCPQAVRTNMSAIVEGGGVAGVDGMIEPEDLARVTVEGLREEKFLILPHEVVRTYYQRKGQDIDRWLAGHAAPACAIRREGRIARGAPGPSTRRRPVIGPASPASARPGPRGDRGGCPGPAAGLDKFQDGAYRNARPVRRAPSEVSVDGFRAVPRRAGLRARGRGVPRDEPLATT